MLPPLVRIARAQITSSFAGARVLVVGDAMLDKFIVGRVTRISPEAPVPVVAFDHEMHRIGGSANVAHNVAALGGQATLVAVTGQDEAPRRWPTPAAKPASRRRSSATPAGRRRPRCASSPSATSRWRGSTTRPDAEIAGEVEQRVIAEIQKHAPQRRRSWSRTT